MRLNFAAIVLLLPVSCATTRSLPYEPPVVRSWGSMREALKLGRSEGRVQLVDIIGDTTMGVGALEGLNGEITIAAGQAFLAQKVDGELHVRSVLPEDQATVLVIADVAEWQSEPLPACANYEDLEKNIAAALEARGWDLESVQPFRVTGHATALQIHAIDGSCPIANPTGQPPWRFDGGNLEVELIGFFVEGAAGEFTHHNHRSHVHGLSSDRQLSGHLDGVSLSAGALLWLPKR